MSEGGRHGGMTSIGGGDKSEGGGDKSGTVKSQRGVTSWTCDLTGDEGEGALCKAKVSFVAPKTVCSNTASPDPKAAKK